MFLPHACGLRDAFPPLYSGSSDDQCLDHVRSVHSYLSSATFLLHSHSKILPPTLCCRQRKYRPRSFLLGPFVVSVCLLFLPRGPVQLELSVLLQVVEVLHARILLVLLTAVCMRTP